jgi:hypothetical protein
MGKPQKPVFSIGSKWRGVARGGLDGPPLSTRPMGKENAEIHITRLIQGDWTDNARRLGKALRRGYKNWLLD